MLFRTVEKKDLEAINWIENQGFTPAEAATTEALVKRIEIIPDTFIVGEVEGEIIGYVNGPIIPERYIRDELFEEVCANTKTGGYQSVLGLAVHPEKKQQGIGSELLTYLKQLSVAHQRTGITLTCREELIPFYEKNGFVNEGLSESQHGGIQWFNMIWEQ